MRMHWLMKKRKGKRRNHLVKKEKEIREKDFELKKDFEIINLLTQLMDGLSLEVESLKILQF